jgi:hypothetical protein
MSNTNTTAVTITGSGKIAAVINGQPYSVDRDHVNYLKIIEAIKSQDWQKFVELTDIATSISRYISSDVQVKDGLVYFKGEAIHNTLANRIVKFMGDGLPYEPLVKFLENLMQNPSHRAVNELYDFLEAGELPITTDGHFLAYKNVKADYKDIHSGTFDNSVGKVCEMPRNKVDEDKDRTCSSGLHFCSIKYLPHFSDSNGGHTMIVKINPKDVVAIPADYNNTKGRCARYEVVAEYTEDWRSKLGRGESGWGADLYDEDGSEYEDEDSSCYCEDCGDELTGYHDNYDDCLCESCNSEDDDYNEEEQYPTDTDFPGGQYEKPTYHNLRDEKGRFIKREEIENSIVDKFIGKLKNIVNSL